MHRLIMDPGTCDGRAGRGRADGSDRADLLSIIGRLLNKLAAHG